MQPGDNLDRLWFAQRPVGAAGDVACSAIGTGGDHAQHDQFRKTTGFARVVSAVVLALIRSVKCLRAAHRIPLLSAEGTGAARAQLRERVSRRDRAIHGSVQFLRRRRETVLYPLRDPARADHPVRHLQLVLSRRPHRSHSCRCSRGGVHMSPNEPPGPATSRLARVIGITALLIIGIVLLSPGVCALGFMVASGFEDLSDGLLIVLWLICFAIAAGGVAIIRQAVKWWRTG